MLWGSIDSYNTIEFLSGGSVIGSKTGTDVINQVALGGSPANYEKVGLFTFGFDQGETFDKVRFGSTPVAFAFALAPAPVPLPAAVWMLAAGIAGLSAAARRRKRSSLRPPGNRWFGGGLRSAPFASDHRRRARAERTRTRAHRMYKPRSELVRKCTEPRAGA